MTVDLTQPAYTLVYDPNPNGVTYTSTDFQKALEKGTDSEKIETMKRILVTMLDGNALPDLLMHVIRFVMPSKDKQLKKLLYFYWEIVPKLDREGKLKQEMILVCNAIQHDLQHPNEYIRGNTLRFLTKLKEPELLEQMVPSVRSCLEYRHAYVRKYAILAVLSIFKVSEHLIPDACEILDSFLVAETDPVCKRNAFVGLAELDRDAALNYLQDNLTSIENLDSLLQIAFIGFIRRDAIRTPALIPQYAELLLDLLQSTNSNEVLFESAISLTSLTNKEAVLSTVASKLVDLAIKESDNNIKLIVLEKIKDIHQKNPGSLEDLTLSILRVLSAQDLDVRAKGLEIALDLISSRNVDTVVKLLKKELQSTTDNSNDKTLEYRQLLIKAIHKVAIRFIEVSADVVSLLLDFIGNLSSEGASDVIAFTKEVIERYPALREEIISTLLGFAETVKSAKAYRGILWLLGEHCESESDIQNAWKHIRSSIGEVPIVQSELKRLNKDSSDIEEFDIPAVSTRPIVLPDGTYATESALGIEDKNDNISKDESDSRPPLRRFIILGDFYTASVLSTAIVKLILKFEKISKNESFINALKAEGLLMLVSIIRVGHSNLVEKKIDEDSEERIMTAISILLDQNSKEDSGLEHQLLQLAFLDATKNSYKSRVDKNLQRSAKKKSSLLTKNAEPIDKAVSFRQLKGSALQFPAVDTINEDLRLAMTGSMSYAKLQANSITSKLKKIVPLTGFSDPVYAECYIMNHQFDVVMDVLLVNQTKETLKNLHVQFATLGDLKIIDNPPSTNVVPHGFHKISITAKVSSADTGVIFGNIVYDGAHGEDSKYVILNDVHIDTMDYVKPATCDDASFRKMWNAFEWENKLRVKSKLPSVHDYLEKLLEVTHMNILTSPDALGDKDSRFLSCNLYSKSTFGEDALANLCIEKDPDTGEIVGEIRIRSKTQGLALTNGDNITKMGRTMNTISVDRV